MIKTSPICTREVELFLINFKFTEDQKVKLIPLLHQQTNLYHFLKQRTTALIGKKYELSLSQITDICCQDNGFLNLQAFFSYYHQLREMGFDFQNISSILEYHNAHFIFPLINKYAPKLLSSSLKPAEIVYLFQMINDETQIEAYKPYLKELFKLNLTKENLFDVFCKNLLDKSIQLYRAALQRGFKTNDILQLMNADNQLIRFEKIIENYTQLKKYGLKNTQLINLALEHGCEEKIDMMIEKFPKLIYEEFSPEKLLFVLFAENGIQNISMLHKLSDKLIHLQFTRDEMIKMVNHPNGAFRLQALSKRAPDLISLKQTPIKILMTVLHEINMIDSELCQNDSELCQNEMTQYLIEINTETESYFLSQMNLEFFSMFASKPKSKEMDERLNMSIEDIESQENYPHRLKIFSSFCKN